MTDDDEPYCRECGGDDLAYLEQYANGCEYKCRRCGHVFMANAPKSDE